MSRVLIAALALACGLPNAGAQEPAPSSGRIKGSVTGSQGRREVVGARVVARTSQPERDVLFLTTTDATGQYLFDGLPPGSYDLSALAEGAPPQKFKAVQVRPPFRNILDFRVAAPQETVDLDVAPPQAVSEAQTDAPAVSVRGDVRSQDGSPLADAEVAFTGGPPPGRRLVLSREDGTFLLPELPAAVYELAVTAPGSLPIRVPGVEVRAGRPLEVQVRLVDYPVELATRRGIILPAEAPLPPRRWLPLPDAPDPALPPPPDPGGSGPPPGR